MDKKGIVKIIDHTFLKADGEFFVSFDELLDFLKRGKKLDRESFIHPPQPLNEILNFFKRAKKFDRKTLMRLLKQKALIV